MLLEDEYQELLKQNIEEDEGAGDIADHVDALLVTSKHPRALSEYPGAKPRGLSEFRKTGGDDRNRAESHFGTGDANGQEFMITSG